MCNVVHLICRSSSYSSNVLLHIRDLHYSPSNLFIITLTRIGDHIYLSWRARLYGREILENGELWGIVGCVHGYAFEVPPIPGFVLSSDATEDHVVKNPLGVESFWASLTLMRIARASNLLIVLLILAGKCRFGSAMALKIVSSNIPWEWRASRGC